MSRIPQPYCIQKRKDTNTFLLTINPESGVPRHICYEWQRKSFCHLPDCLAQYRRPKSRAAAETAVVALIQHLKKEGEGSAPAAWVSADAMKVGQWLERFISLDDNPRSARIMGAGSQYSIETIETYRLKYERYVKGDPFCEIKMRETEQTHCLEFIGRLGMKEKDKRYGSGIIAGTRTYEITVKFVRMAFNE